MGFSMGKQREPSFLEVLQYNADWPVESARQVHGDVHELVLIVGGEYTGHVDSGKLNAQSGDAIIYPAGASHLPSWAEDDPRLDFFVLRWRGGLGPVQSDEPLMRRDRDGHISAITRWLWELQLEQAEGDAYKRTLDALLYSALYEFSRCDPSPTDDMVNRVRRYIQTNLRDEITLEDLSKVAGLSRFHFSRLFRKATGQPPMTFLRAIRVEAARSYLQTTDAPLKAIAPAVGFSDEQQLSRVFRRVAGISPGSVRRRRNRHRENASYRPDRDRSLMGA